MNKKHEAWNFPNAPGGSLAPWAQWSAFVTKLLPIRAVQWDPRRGAEGVERHMHIPGYGVLRSEDAKCEYLVRPGDWIIDHPQAYPIILPPEWVAILLTRKP